jgi:hypothetical protein
MLDLIETYNISNFEVNEEAERLANAYVRDGIIPAHYWFDSVHIAIASVHKLQCVMSYNFEHINRLKTKLAVSEINSREGYRSAMILYIKGGT